MRRVYAFSKGRVNPDSHGQWVQIDLFDGEFCCGLAGRREQFDVSAGAKHCAGPSAISHQPSADSRLPLSACANGAWRKRSKVLVEKLIRVDARGNFDQWAVAGCCPLRICGYKFGKSCAARR